MKNKLHLNCMISIRSYIPKYFLAILLLFFSTISCKKDGTEDFDLGGKKIGVYLDNGVWDACYTSTQDMLNEMECSYTALNKDSILSGKLDHYDLLLMPGGEMWTYKSHLTTAGMNKIKEFISNGGGYIGICGGAYFTASRIDWHGWADEARKTISMYGLDLFSGIADGPSEDFAPTYEVPQCSVYLADKTHPVCKGIPDIITPYYHHGPVFFLNDSTGISIIGKTETGDNLVIMAFQYNSGRVFITGNHPEFDSTRSSWELFKNAIRWSLKSN